MTILEARVAPEASPAVAVGVGALLDATEDEPEVRNWPVGYSSRAFRPNHETHPIVAVRFGEGRRAECACGFAATGATDTEMARAYGAHSPPSWAVLRERRRESRRA